LGKGGGKIWSNPTGRPLLGKTGSFKLKNCNGGGGKKESPKGGQTTLAGPKQAEPAKKTHLWGWGTGVLGQRRKKRGV